ncbi:tRNA uridine-5-carboxymethylaminomethyl(34) synthesis enzyme MnmG [Ichthyobacterium seriolicida]|uniref:tRNA uridine 5-carboxymethylaminomethyl modification enzyme MnmG n=1 Tax=Ichthyobacterium seriolicida TaxID=242600 RepID=A0A1J1E527_9FLAO|nr:tRNA uridine-5-carboxymethylaminomethyl(34) synthesis enzyme MnmG [Ichthyobacterium seriolicida]BAV94414.1 tRNA uridine 5-carboxymethylaminomethyl modification enzyme GidA [Ichthyobacterium seriolicida]
MFNEYDVIVVGAGHAGSEAAAAAANLGAKTLLVTMSLQNIAQMSCNPAIGGIAKGQIVREIDALGGQTGIVTDKTMVQFRMLNRSKGPAMWSPRAQSDRMRFAEEWRSTLERTKNLDFYQEKVSELLIKNNRVEGVKTSLGIEIKSKSVILTNGTFLNGIIHIGQDNFGGGRMGESSSKGITKQLISLGFVHGRMKTGTPPRVDARSLDFSKMEEQKGDENPGKFSFTKTPELKEQKSCFITYTNKNVHEILKTGFSKSPMFTNKIDGVGPRYCPSVEDKINRFSERERHQIFVEPEGWNTVETYVNGFSTSLPKETQIEALKQIPGFEKVKIFRFGYAIEYDYFPPTQLLSTLETRITENLYFAGQINGTTGYEEAAAQGLMAGINAVKKIKDEAPFTLKRNEAYIGVLIDDLITKGTEEPYRMFTSRAEYRILLRQDNADLRLTKLGHEIGLASTKRLKELDEKFDKINKTISFIKNKSLEKDDINKLLKERESSPVNQKQKAASILSRPQINIDHMMGFCEINSFAEENNLNSEILEQVEIQIKYEGYIDREKQNAEKLDRLEDIKIPSHFEYDKLPSLSSEAKEKLMKTQPKTIAQASRISGVSPSDISILLVYMGR